MKTNKLLLALVLCLLTAGVNGAQAPDNDDNKPQCPGAPKTPQGELQERLLATASQRELDTAIRQLALYLAVNEFDQKKEKDSNKGTKENS